MIKQESFKEASDEFLNSFLSQVNWADKMELRSTFSNKEEILSNARAIPERILWSKTSKHVRLINAMTLKYSTIMAYLKQGDSILDVCSGSGFGANILAKSGYKVTAVDIFTDIIRYRKGIEIYQGNVMNGLDMFQMFNGVTLIDCIEHFTQEDQIKLLTLVRDTLAPDGVLVIDTPHTKRSGYGSKNHLWELSWRDFSELVRSCGFKINKKYQTAWFGDTGMGVTHEYTYNEPACHEISDQIIVATHG